MSPTREKVFNEDTFEAIHKKRNVRRQMLRRKMLEEQKPKQLTRSQSFSSPSKPISPLKLNSASVTKRNSSPIRLRTQKPAVPTSPNTKPINIAITFNASSKRDNQREFRAFELTKVKPELKVKQEKPKKQWPKLVCSMEITALTSSDAILTGAVLPREINLGSPSPAPPLLYLSPKIPITAPPPSSPPPSSLPPRLSPCAEPNQLYDAKAHDSDGFLIPKKRRVVLSDRPPLIFKRPSYVANFKPTTYGDLRRKITGKLPTDDKTDLKMPEDDCISIFAQTDIITDEDLTVDIPASASTQISPTKKEQIMNWVAQSKYPSTSFESDINAPTFPSDILDKFVDSPQSFKSASVSDNSTAQHRFDRFQISFNSDADSERSESSKSESIYVSNAVTVQPDESHPFKIPYSVNAKCSKASSNSKFGSFTSNSRSSSDFPSSVSEYDASDCSASVVPTKTNNVSQIIAKPPAQKQRIRNRWSELSETINDRNIDLINKNDQIKMSPPMEQITQRSEVINNTSKTDDGSHLVRNLISHTTQQKPAASKNISNSISQFPKPPPNKEPFTTRNPQYVPSNNLARDNFQKPPPKHVPNLHEPSNFNNRFAPQHQRQPPLPITATLPNVQRGGYRQMRPSSHSFPPRPNGQQQNWVPTNHETPLQQLQSISYKLCSRYYREGSCRHKVECRKYHKCPEVMWSNVSYLNSEELRGVVKKYCEDNLHGVICELLVGVLQVFVSQSNKMAILELVHPVLKVDCSRYGNLQMILNGLCQLKLSYKDAVLKVLYYVGASNEKLVDILFDIIIGHCDPAKPSNITSNWAAIDTLLESAPRLDHGVFNDLCAKYLQQPFDSSDGGTVLFTIGRILATEPCKVDVKRMDQQMIGRLCERLRGIYDSGGLGEALSRRLLARLGLGVGLMDQDDRVMEAPQLATISSSTITGSSNSNFKQVSMQIPKSTNIIHANDIANAINTERKQNNCSPDSSSYAATAINTNPPSTRTPPLPKLTSPLHLYQPHLIHSPNPSLIAYSHSSPPPSSVSPPTTTMHSLMESHSLYISIVKYKYNNAAMIIARERESIIEPICKMLHSKAVPVTMACSFFDVLWDHMGEHFLQYIELKRVVLYVLFNIYEFLLKEKYFTDAASLITTRFSNEKEQFLSFKTFLASGQCSPMQKCHKVIKLLLSEKILPAAYDWFIREEYQTLSISADMNDCNFVKEKSDLITEFLQLSHRDLNVGLNLVVYCMNRHLGDYKIEYNCILQQMITSADHKEKVLALREQLYNDQYVYINSQTLRSFIVDFFSHLSLQELLHIYDIISRDDVYPKLTGHENSVTIRNTLKENELMLILTAFLHQINQNQIEVAWDVNVRFKPEVGGGPDVADVRTGSILYPRNLLMCSTGDDAVKRLVNVLRSFIFTNTPADTNKWHACPTSGTVTLYKDHVQAMVRNYRGTQTFT